MVDFAGLLTDVQIMSCNKFCIKASHLKALDMIEINDYIMSSLCSSYSYCSNVAAVTAMNS